MEKIVKTSKFLSFILRHNPGTIGLKLDEKGWASVDELITKANAHGKNLTRDLVFEVVVKNDKQRFALSPDKDRIRANQGHSISIDLDLKPQNPPQELFHGTALHSLESIQKKGIRPGTRQHVHLSKDQETAIAVGQRHGKPVVLRIAARAMADKGHLFFQSENQVWLTDFIPPEFISPIFPKKA